MISEEALRDIRACVQAAIEDGREPQRYADDYERALNELEEAVEQHRQQAVTVAKPDPAAARYAADVKLVADTIAHHVRAGLLDMHPRTHPEVGELWPTSTYASAQWHATRAQLLAAAPVTVAAAALREEALAALDTNPKETP